jgi:hypothetical protein
VKAWEGYRVPVANNAPHVASKSPFGDLRDAMGLARAKVSVNGKEYSVPHSSEPTWTSAPGNTPMGHISAAKFDQPMGEISGVIGAESPQRMPDRPHSSAPGLETPFDSLPEVHERGSSSRKHAHRASKHDADASDENMWNPDRQMAFGGLFSSGGLARVSNGEYRINAGAVTKYGAGVMAMLNSGQFASGGLVGDADTSNPGRFDDWGNGMSRGLSASLPPGISSEDRGSHSEHTLDLVTHAGQFRMQASADTIEAIRASAIGQKLTSTGVKPGWY